METSAQQIWDSAQNALRCLVNPETYKLWFASVVSILSSMLFRKKNKTAIKKSRA